MKKAFLLIVMGLLIGCQSSNAVYYPITITEVEGCTWRQKLYNRDVKNCYVEGIVFEHNLIIKGQIFTNLGVNESGRIRCNLKKDLCHNEIN